MPFLARLLPAGWGLRMAVLVLAVLALFALLSLLRGCYDRGVIKEEDARREGRAAQARETAAAERTLDDIVLRQNEEKLRDAIEAAPTGGAVSAPARALACERLRRRGNPPPECQ